MCDNLLFQYLCICDPNNFIIRHISFPNVPEYIDLLRQEVYFRIIYRINNIGPGVFVELSYLIFLELIETD